MANQTEQEFLLDVLRMGVDFNSQTNSILAVELAGDQSGKNKTHQKKVLEDLRILGSNYSFRLDSMYDKHEKEKYRDGAKSKYDKATTDALRRVLSLLESMITAEPNQQLTDTANYVEMLLKNAYNANTVVTKPKGNINEAIKKGDDDLPKPPANPTPSPAGKGK